MSDNVVPFKGKAKKRVAKAQDGWRAELLYREMPNGGAVLKKNIANVITILRNDERWAGVLAYDAFAGMIVTTARPPFHEYDAPADLRLGEWGDVETNATIAWFSRTYEIDVGADIAIGAVMTVAHARQIHPVRDYLGALQWDGEARIATWLHKFLGAADTEYTRAVGARWMIAAVARVHLPGCKVDTVLVLEGTQGLKKSSALHTLAGEAWFFDSEIELGSKDAYQALRGKWILELGELSALSRAELNRTKQFFTSRTDSYRPSYGKRVVDVPRQCVFAGTTNKTAYLIDDTGNRRFWPVACTRVDLEGLSAARDQLWAEAVARFKAGEAWHLDDVELVVAAEAEQESRRIGDPWEGPIAAWLAGDKARLHAAEGITTADVLAGAIKLEVSRGTRADEMRVAAILQRIGWQKGTRKRRDGVRIYPFYPAIASQRGWAGQEGTGLGTDVGTASKPANDAVSYPCPNLSQDNKGLEEAENVSYVSRLLLKTGGDDGTGRDIGQPAGHCFSDLLGDEEAI